MIFLIIGKRIIRTDIVNNVAEIGLVINTEKSPPEISNERRNSLSAKEPKTIPKIIVINGKRIFSNKYPKKPNPTITKTSNIEFRIANVPIVQNIIINGPIMEYG